MVLKNVNSLIAKQNPRSTTTTYGVQNERFYRESV